mmetsp:Transcript_78254/g.217310  ORF Transcript_78254/g.217310 Transcript_78254/m.217310 type:complete len:441 (+) Transcript_78254:155-1477(+)
MVVCLWPFLQAGPRCFHSTDFTVVNKAALIVTGFACLVVRVAAGGSDCKLRNMFLRSLADENGNAGPIDIFPVAHDTSRFWALMDYAMTGFQLEAYAIPADHCEPKLEVPATQRVDPGSSVMAELYVHDTKLASSTPYHVNVSRLSGKETSVMKVWIENARLDPPWDTQVRDYIAHLDVSEDLVRFVYELLDNGQTVSLNSELQVLRAPAPAGAGSTPSNGAAAGDRRLTIEAVASGEMGLDSPIGEVQRWPSRLLTTIDIGHERLVELQVKSADLSASGAYRFKVQRSFCPEERRFFDGVAKVCTDVCNEGYFGDHATGRCTNCLQEHCLVCDSAGDSCSMCGEGFILAGGGCVAMGLGALGSVGELESSAEAYASQHRVLLLAAVSVCLVALCACAAVTCVSRGGFGLDARNPRLLESDDDEFSSLRDYDSHRRYYNE